LAAPASEPRVRVAAVLPIDGRVVLVRHRKGASTYYLLPGGGVEFGETLEAALEREVREETGLLMRIRRPLFISDTLDTERGRHIVHVMFLADVTGGRITASPADTAVEEVTLTPYAELTRLDLRPPIGAVLATAAAGGFTAETRYLGALWVPES
jgi:8-oxo-dGTP diphosphatase